MADLDDDPTVTIEHVQYLLDTMTQKVHELRWSRSGPDGWFIFAEAFGTTSGEPENWNRFVWRNHFLEDAFAARALFDGIRTSVMA